MSEKIYRVQMNSKGMPNFSTAEEIIRCGECKKGHNGWCYKHGRAFEPNDFCSYGEREGE